VITIIRKENEVKWVVESRNYFDQIKKAFTEAPMLINLEYSKGFLIFSFASSDTLAIVFLQKNIEGLEQPISFFSRALMEAEMRYNIMEKQAYDLVKTLKDFKIYVLHSNVITYIPLASVKDILIQPDIDGRRRKWISKILEFDLEIRPTKLVKGQGLARMLDESNCKVSREIVWGPRGPIVIIVEVIQCKMN
jgi:hypothetical protein